MKLLSWNVNGIRAAKKKGFDNFILAQNPDVYCIQETKIDKSLKDSIETPKKDYSPQYSFAYKKGYSGVSTVVNSKHLSNLKEFSFGLGDNKFDNEGRFVISKFDNFNLYNIYFPSGTSGVERQNYKYAFLDYLYSHLDSLPKKEKEKTIICGDFNICHREIDIHHPKIATRNELSGFLPEERAWMDKFIELGFTDAFRHSNGEIENIYSWWSYRAGSRGKNLGWRIDYFFVADAMKNSIKKAEILTEVEGSDHCPITLEIKI